MGKSNKQHLEDAWKEFERTGEICNAAEGLLNHCTALTEINRLQSEENKQLAEDNAKLREALAGLKLDSIKVIDSLVNTGCGEAWSIIKLNNMITDIEDALKTECTTCDNSNEAEEFKQLQQDKAELREALESLFCSIDDDLTCCMNERKLQIIGHLLEKHKCN